MTRLTLSQYQSLLGPVDIPKLQFSVEEMTNLTPRTLAFGYTCNRDTFHVYLDAAGQLNRLLYRHDGSIISHDVATAMDAELLVPNKRLYPETCDLEFCTLLRPKLEYGLPFTSYNIDREDAQFYGKVVNDNQRVA